MWPSKPARLLIAVTCVALLVPRPAGAQVFVDGLAQPVFSVSGPDLITQQVWVEVPGVDVDRDGFNDRIRVQIRRPAVTNNGVTLPIILVASTEISIDTLTSTLSLPIVGGAQALAGALAQE